MEDKIYTTFCPSCGYENGCRFVNEFTPDLPDKPDPNECVMCGEETEWREL